MSVPNGCCHPPADHSKHRPLTYDVALRGQIEALVAEHERTVTPAPYTSERALIERLRALLDGSPA